MGKRSKTTKKLKHGLRKLGGAVKTAYSKRGEYIQKGRELQTKVAIRTAQIQAKAQKLQETYPVFGGTEELFGFNQPQKAALKSPDLMGNVSGVGIIDFGLGDYAGRAAPVPRVDEKAIQKEMLEHPWADRATAERIAKDHKRKRRH